MNKTILIGRLTRDPELRTTNSGVSVASFTLAVNRTYTSNGEREADFINCIAFNKQAENLTCYIRKGGQIGVEGRIQTRSYTAQDGAKRYVTEVVCDAIHYLEPKKNEQNYNSYEPAPYDIPNPNNNPYSDVNPFDDDDLPF